MSYLTPFAARFSQFLSYLIALAWLLLLLVMRHLLTQILIRFVTLSLSLSLSLSSMFPSTYFYTGWCNSWPSLFHLCFLQHVSIQVGVIPDHPLPTSFPKDEEGFCNCLQDPASACYVNRVQLFARWQNIWILTLHIALGNMREFFVKCRFNLILEGSFNY
jgi:hypothetical protein